jgi:hypothetical protein
METPQTPRHPSNGYEIANGTPLPAPSTGHRASPLAIAQSLPQCTAYSPFVSPSIRRRSQRLQSPGKNLDLRLGSVEEEEPSSVASLLDDSPREDVGQKTKRRRSLRLQEKQITPTKPSPPAKSSSKKSNKKRRQSAHFGSAKLTVDEGKAGAVAGGEGLDLVTNGSSKSTHPSNKKKRRQSAHFGIAKSSVIEKASVADAASTSKESPNLCLAKEAHDEIVLVLETIASNLLGTILEEHELEVPTDIHELDMLNDSMEQDKENRPTISAIKRRKGRRDTFDLSKKRGLRVGPSVLEAACTPGSNTKDVKDQRGKAIKSAGICVDTSHDEEMENEELKKKLFITPKNSEVNVDVEAELSMALNDDPLLEEVVEVNPEMQAKMDGLSSVAVEERMKSLFAEFKVYNYVSNAHNNSCDQNLCQSDTSCPFYYSHASLQESSLQ